VHVVLDVMLPAERVVDALKSFREEFPTVALHLHMEALGAVTELVINRGAVVGVSGPMNDGINGIERIGIGSVELIPVAAPNHPLATAEANVPGAGREHTQLVLSDRSVLTKDKDFAVLSNRTWRLADLGAKHMLLREGIGWGNMPRPMIQEDLDSGRLIQLDMPEYTSGQYTFDAIYRTDVPPGPAARWLIERFVQQNTQEA
jgi:DNA-binding transcriptional LysR family regulator